MATISAQDDRVSIEGYDDLDSSSLVEQLRLQSQIELTNIDAYERAHQDRKPVLDKLNHLRGPEPIDRYDELDSDEVLAALSDADMDTLRAVRSYEAKLRERPDVLRGLMRLRQDKQSEDNSAQGQENESSSGTGLMHKAGDVGFSALVVFAVLVMVVAVVMLTFLILDAVAPALFI